MGELSSPKFYIQTMEKDYRNLHIMTVTGPDINNGPGFRITIWVSGCTHKCHNCQNKHTWKYGQGHCLDDNYNRLPDMTYKKKIMSLISDTHIDGITISGGDPLDQDQLALEELRDFLYDMKKRYPKKTIWLYTGCLYEDLTYFQLQVARYCDVIVDGRYEEENRDITLPYRGSSNQRLIDVKKSMIEGRTVTLNDDEFKS